MLLVKVALYQLDAKMPLDLQDELKDVDGIDFKFSAEKRLIVAQIGRGQVGDPQAIQYDGLKLLLDGRHIVYLKSSIPQSASHKRFGSPSGRALHGISCIPGTDSLFVALRAKATAAPRPQQSPGQ